MEGEWLKRGLGIEGEMVKVMVEKGENGKDYEKLCDGMKGCKCIE